MAMAFSLGSRYLTFSFLFMFFFFFTALPVETLGAKPTFSFSLERFEKNGSLGSEIALYGDAEIGDSVVRVTRPVISSTGRIVYRKPIKVLGRNPGFSTYFSFSFSKGKESSLAFLVIPSSVSLESTERHWFQISPNVLAVEFGTSMNGSSSEPSGNHIEINVGGEAFVKSSNLSDADSVLNNGKKLHCWIDYDGVSKRLEVRLGKSRSLKPLTSLISYPIDLSGLLLRGAMFVGISSSNGNSAQTSSIYSWNFVLKHGAPYLMHSEPLDPRSFIVRSNEGPPIHPSNNYSWRIIVAMAFGAACGALVVLIVFFFRSAFIRRHPVAPVEYSVHPVEMESKKIVLVGDKGVKIAAK